jgi:nitrogen-specific signal transduction histidine kinase
MLAAEVAHEIGTPLNVIAGRAEHRRSIHLDHPERRHLDLMLGQTERISGIIRALLDYSRPRRPALRKEAVTLILARVADLLLGRCRAKDVRIHLALPVGLPEVWGDADQLQQVFLNLLLNALDASPRGGTIRITEGPEPVLPADGREAITRGKTEAPCLGIHIVDEGGGIRRTGWIVFRQFFSTRTEERAPGWDSRSPRKSCAPTEERSSAGIGSRHRGGRSFAGCRSLRGAEASTRDRASHGGAWTLTG